jgi:hypothetical protein
VYEETTGRGAPSGGGDPRTQDSPDNAKSLRVRNDEKCETRYDGND